MSRTGRIERATPENKVLVEIELDGTGATDVETGMSFYDHLLGQFGKSAKFDLTVHSMCNLQLGAHRAVKDTAAALGQAFRQALGEASGVQQYGHISLPLEDALVTAAIDVLGRPYIAHSEPEMVQTMTFGGTLHGTFVRQVWEAFTQHALVSLHVSVQAGWDPHNIVEAQFKAVARVLKEAVQSETAPTASLGPTPSLGKWN